MKDRVGDTFEGMVSSVTSFGMYVELASTIEGLVQIETLPGAYSFDGLMELVSLQGGRRFRIGDRVRVKCTGADVNAGHVDFIVAE